MRQLEERRLRVSGFVRAAAGADIIVLPDLWPAGYASVGMGGGSLSLPGQVLRHVARSFLELRNGYCEAGHNGPVKAGKGLGGAQPSTA